MEHPTIEISFFDCSINEVGSGDSSSAHMGRLLLAFREGKLVSLDFTDYQARFDQLLNKRWPMAVRRQVETSKEMHERLSQYFQGDFSAFDGLVFETAGTEFQDQVWQQLTQIPVGKTWTYGQLAATIDKPNASRAVGQTNGLNPIAIVLPCHRVVGGSGKLTGYAGGLKRKEWLLRHEGALGLLKE